MTTNRFLKTFHYWIQVISVIKATEVRCCKQKVCHIWQDQSSCVSWTSQTRRLIIQETSCNRDTDNYLVWNKNNVFIFFLVVLLISCQKFHSLRMRKHSFKQSTPRTWRGYKWPSCGVCWRAVDSLLVPDRCEGSWVADDTNRVLQPTINMSRTWQK